MTKTFKLNTIAAGMLACVAVLPASSYAITCALSGQCMTTTRQEAAQTRARIAQMENAVSRSVDTTGNRIVNAIANSTSASTAAMAQNAANISNAQAELAKAKAKRELEQSMPCINCSHTAAAQGPRSGGARGAKHASGTDSDYVPDNVDIRLEAALNASGQTVNKKIPPISSEVYLANLGAGACKTFADPNSIRGKLCKQADAAKEKPTPYVDADIKAATLFDGPQKRGKGSALKNWSVPAKGAQRDARSTYLTMLNATAPGSPRQITMGTPEASAYMGKRAEYEAALSLAAYPSLEFDRLTTIDPDTKQALTAFERSDSKFMQAYFKDTDLQKTYKQGVSPLTMLDIEVERRVGNPEWLKRIVASSPETKAAEQLMIDAYSLRLQRDMYIALLQNNVLLGKILQNSTVQRYTDELDSMRQGMQQSTN